MVFVLGDAVVDGLCIGGQEGEDLGLLAEQVDEGHEEVSLQSVLVQV